MFTQLLSHRRTPAHLFTISVPLFYLYYMYSSIKWIPATLTTFQHMPLSLRLNCLWGSPRSPPLAFRQRLSRGGTCQTSQAGGMKAPWQRTAPGSRTEVSGKSFQVVNPAKTGPRTQNKMLCVTCLLPSEFHPCRGASVRDRALPADAGYFFQADRTNAWIWYVCPF